MYLRGGPGLSFIPRSVCVCVSFMMYLQVLFHLTDQVLLCTDAGVAVCKIRGWWHKIWPSGSLLRRHGRDGLGWLAGRDGG